SRDSNLSSISKNYMIIPLSKEVLKRESTATLTMIPTATRTNNLRNRNPAEAKENGANRKKTWNPKQIPNNKQVSSNLCAFYKLLCAVFRIIKRLYQQFGMDKNCLKCILCE